MENFNRTSLIKFFKSRKNLQLFNSREGRAKFISVMYKIFMKESILDVGCGDRQLFEFSGEWEGIDFNTTIKNDKVVIADFFKHDFNREFDMVLIAGVVEHYKGKKIREFLETAFKVNPKYIVITLFFGIKEGGSRTFGLDTSEKMYPMTRFGRESTKKTLDGYKFDNYFIKKIGLDSVIVIRRKKNERT